MGITETDADNVRDEIINWDPPKDGKDEGAYRDNLYRYLHERFPKETFHKEYMVGKSKADIYVKLHNGAKVVIELKKGLKDRNEYHRLIGQAYEYLTECEVEVVVVLCCNSDPALIKLSKDFTEKFTYAFSKKVRFINKA